MGWGSGNIGGGGTSLNFRVVGGLTQPAGPKENTIWVQTETKITSWSFNASEPTEATGGMVWFLIGTSSASAFSVTKKNPIMIYPLSAKQYVSGSWQDVTAKSFQSGRWVDWIIYLFNYGSTFDSMSGGWSNVVNDHIEQKSGDTTSKSGAIPTLKDYNTLYFTYALTNAHGSGNGNISLTVYSMASAKLSSWTKATKELTVGQKYTETLDISAIDVDCYIAFAGWYGSANYYALWVE